MELFHAKEQDRAAVDRRLPIKISPIYVLTHFSMLKTNHFHQANFVSILASSTSFKIKMIPVFNSPRKTKYLGKNGT